MDDSQSVLDVASCLTPEGLNKYVFMTSLTQFLTLKGKLVLYINGKKCIC